MRRGPLALAALAWALSGCDPGESDAERLASETPGPLMRPGWNCLASGCHFPDKQPKPPDWSAGGTVYRNKNSRASDGLAGATIVLRDEDGKEVRLQSNAAGNFNSAEPLSGSLDVTVEFQGRSIKMPKRAPAGSCNFCHAPPPSEAGGRIYAP